MDTQVRAATAHAAASHGEGAQASPPAHSHALTLFRRPALGASPCLSSAFEMPPVVGALGYSLSPVQVTISPMAAQDCQQKGGVNLTSAPLRCPCGGAAGLLAVCRPDDLQRLARRVLGASNWQTCHWIIGPWRDLHCEELARVKAAHGVMPSHMLRSCLVQYLFFPLQSNASSQQRR